ncbi:MAG: PTS sugar transporter subunit IIA [Candidatus Latescibacteria bacterium]|nr:PTS sugar transporter subunit IIA [Candidatus Latescibacterota bacterium]
MKLTEILGEHEIKINLEAEDKLEAIEELIDYLISEHEISLRNRDYILEVVFKRESSISTGVGGGIAIPHGTVDCIEGIVGALGISSRGIDFESFDGGPVYIVLLLLIPKTRISKHIKTLANIARILNEPSVRDSIRSARTPGKVFDIIEEAEQTHIV